MDSELQKAHDRVTLMSQKPMEDENMYVDRIIAASYDGSNVFEDRALVHYYVRGLLKTSRDKVLEDMRRLPEHEQRDLTSIRLIAFAECNDVRAQSQATARVRITSHRRPPTLYVSKEQQPEDYFRNSELPYLLNHRAKMIAEFRFRDPETARNIAIRIEIILFAGATSGSATPSSTNPDAIDSSVGVDLVRTPLQRETVPIPTLTEKQTREAFSVFPSDYWQVNWSTCRDCGHSNCKRSTLTRASGFISRIVTTSTESRETPRWRSFSSKRRKDDYSLRKNERGTTVNTPEMSSDPSRPRENTITDRIPWCADPITDTDILRKKTNGEATAASEVSMDILGEEESYISATDAGYT